MSQKVTIVTSAVAVAAAVTAVVSAVETCDIRVQDQVSDAGATIDAMVDAQVPTGSGRWGSAFASCNNVSSCDASIACENHMREELHIPQLPLGYVCPSQDAAIPNVSLDASADAAVGDAGTIRWGSLLGSCNLATTCAMSVACENSRRAHFRCQFSVSVAPVLASVPPGTPMPYTVYGSLIKECDEAATCAESIACENRARATQSCQYTRTAP